MNSTRVFYGTIAFCIVGAVASLYLKINPVEILLTILGIGTMLMSVSYKMVLLRWGVLIVGAMFTLLGIVLLMTT
jgi:hypothetical protein